MRYDYGEYDGQPFPTPDSLFPQPKVVQFILQYGQKALDAMDKLDSDEEREFLEQMIAAGLLERDAQTGQLRLTPKMVRGIEHRALLDIFQGLHQGTRDGHTTLDPGQGDERTDGGKAYEFGDPLSEIDLGATMRNAAHRHMQAARESAGPAPPPLPIHLNSDDFELHLTEGHTDTALCILLDMSGSMMRYGRFFQAKRVALGMASLVRARFPQDTVDYVGFYSSASRLGERDLPVVMPKPISVHDYSVNLRVPLEQAADSRVPQHFTNLHMGLRLARQILSRRGAANKQIFIITDGQPTAHVEPNPDGAPGSELLHLLYPPNERTTTITLKEAMRCMQQGIRIATFALIEDYWGLDWVGFVDQLTRLTRGTAYYCSSDDLSSTVIESYLNGKRKKSYIH
ncbi:MAG: hypothetical protein WD042_03605 [Phycisphaeraceae bacterium]